MRLPTVDEIKQALLFGEIEDECGAPQILHNMVLLGYNAAAAACGASMAEWDQHLAGSAYHAAVMVQGWMALHPPESEELREILLIVLAEMAL